MSLEILNEWRITCDNCRVQECVGSATHEEMQKEMRERRWWYVLPATMMSPAVAFCPNCHKEKQTTPARDWSPKNPPMTPEERALQVYPAPIRPLSNKPDLDCLRGIADQIRMAVQEERGCCMDVVRQYATSSYTTRTACHCILVKISARDACEEAK